MLAGRCLCIRGMSARGSDDLNFGSMEGQVGDFDWRRDGLLLTRG